MAKMIELTKAYYNPEEKFLLNADYILTIEKEENKTKITTVESYFTVKENVNQIKEMING